MYSVDDQDRVLELKDVPQSDVGAPSPIVLSDEYVTLLAYELGGEPFPDDGRVLTDADLEMFVQEMALVEFQGCRSYLFGSPNDEAFHGHPLACRGLHPYAAFEIQNSSWIRKLEQMNSVHPGHPGGWLQSLKHFVFAFHDSTFECVARGFTISNHRGSWEPLLLEMQRRLRLGAT
jgi:hypothetical protein